MSTIFYALTDGHTEVKNQAWEQRTCLQSYFHKLRDNWTQKLPFAGFAYANFKHSINGIPSFEATYGHISKAPWQRASLQMGK
ncbi:hypothetical protein OCU04_009374 [Sclerotinia nivalis]|uniref:Uncharacterized protein n=1 Tax=Sclerotinia nivalis TaxID=352851 RepID=A0A9X0DH98_9HELO|nr:hypothetical protein OCU04_009374 [Sclerotinia nivalis]